MTSAPGFKSNWLQWPINRSTKTFRVYVVEPRIYRPLDHADIFYAALNRFISPTNLNYDESLEPFDLISFPEAFLPVDALLTVLGGLPSHLEQFGCVHVGLRPIGENGHLFKTGEIKTLIQALRENDKIEHSDLQSFTEWIDLQRDEGPFNLGCIFTIDAHQKIRVCLHPKLVRSKFERSPIPERNMKEANLLSLVTLLPEDKTLFSITIQPLICSDSLFLDPDRPVRRPLEAINQNANCFGPSPPDLIDIVSVVAWTPQQAPSLQGDFKSQQWHQAFRTSFERALTDSGLSRHHSAVFVLSNFEINPNGSAGGLSGVFLPISLEKRNYDRRFINISAYGTTGHGVCWSTPIKSIPLPANWNDRGYIAYLIPSESENHLARMMGFTIDRLPRHCSRWQDNGLSSIRRQIATAETGVVTFREESETDD